MRLKPSGGFWRPILAGTDLALLAACGEQPRPAPCDKASLVPDVTPPERIMEEMLRLAGVDTDDVVYDRGSGDGRFLIMAAKIYGARGVSFELDASFVGQSTEKGRQAGVSHLVEFRQQDVRKVDPSPATVVTIYPGRDANLKLRPALETQLRAGAVVIARDFDVGVWQPEAVRQLPDDSALVQTLYLWRITCCQPGESA